MSYGADYPHLTHGPVYWLWRPMFMYRVFLVATVVLVAAAVWLRFALPAWLAAVSGAAALTRRSMAGSRRDPARHVRQEGDVVVVELRRDFLVAGAALFLALAAFFCYAAAREFSTFYQVLSAGLAVLVLAPVPDVLRAAISPGHLRLTPSELQIKSWGYSLRLPWDAVVGVDKDLNRPALCLYREDGADLDFRRRRLLLPIEPRPRTYGVLINLFAVDDPRQLQAALLFLGLAPPEMREAHLRTGAITRCLQDPES